MLFRLGESGSSEIFDRNSLEPFFSREDVRAVAGWFLHLLVVSMATCNCRTPAAGKRMGKKMSKIIVSPGQACRQIRRHASCKTDSAMASLLWQDIACPDRC